MPLFGKPKISEAEAASQFVMAIFQKLLESWPSLAHQMRPILGSDASVLDENSASYEFALAAIAIQLQALPNLMPRDQAQRIREYVMECLSTEELGTYPCDTIQEYQNAWDESLRVNEYPHIGIASLLFDKLGCSASVSVRNARIKHPIVLTTLGAALLQYDAIPRWKTVVSKFRIVA